MQTTKQKWCAAFMIIFLLVVFIFIIEEPDIYYQDTTISKDEYLEAGLITKNDNWRSLTVEQKGNLSKLGQILYLGTDYPKNTTPKTYIILIWKHGKSLEKRHIYHYTKHRYDPFSGCSVKNCRISYSDVDLATADLVLFHLHRTRGIRELPKRTGNFDQRWTFITDESPFHTFLHNNGNQMKNYNRLFNWSMTYRMDSDIPVPYGRTLLLTKNNKEHDFDKWNESKNQDILVAIMGSNCAAGNHRWKYVAELQKHIHVDVYGACGKLKCKGHFTEDCAVISKYKFYLAFENSNCKEYITEKVWWNGYQKNSVPIVMGGPRIFYEQLLPPKSFINIEDFASPRDLANYIIYLNKTPSEFKQYFAWKEHFKVVNEHGYFRSNSFHYCRICEALNYNSKDTKVYNNLEKFWGKGDCLVSNWDTHRGQS